MASPVFESSNQAEESTASVQAVTVTAPSGIADDDLLLAAIACSHDTTAVTATGWTELTSHLTHGGSSDGGITVLYKIASSESGNYTFNAGGPARMSAGVLRISGADTTTPFIGTTPSWATGSGTTPDPPASATVTSGDYLFVVVCAQEGNVNGRYTAPTNYTERVDVGNATGGGNVRFFDSVGMFTRALTATSDNPGTITSTFDDDWSANTIIVNPAAAAGFTGTVAATLGAATSSASGTVTEAITGTATPTLGAATASASGTVVESITGTVGVTLAAATSSASGTHTPPGFSGTVSATLGAATSTASGTSTEPPITGTVSVTLAAATSTATGTSVPYLVHDLDSGSSLTVYTTASVTPTADALQILAIHANDATAVNEPTVDGSAAGITWELYATNDDARKLFIYHGVPSSPTTGSTTITFDNVIDGCMWSHTEWPNRLNTTNGADAFAQVASHNQVGFATASHVALQEWVDPTNSIGYAAFIAGTTSNRTADTGWTEIGDVAVSPTSLHIQYAEGEQFKPGVTWTGSAHHIGIAVELLPLVSPPTIPDSITRPVPLQEFGGSGTSGTSSSYSPTDGTLLLAAVDFRRAAGSPVSPSSVTGNNVTWTEVGAVDYNTVGTPTRRMSVWAAKSDGTAGGISVTFGTSADAWRVFVWEVGGVTTNSLSTDDVVQFDTDAQDSVTAINATLGAFSDALNGTLAFVVDVSANDYIEVEDGIALANADTPSTFWLAWQFSNNTTPGVAVMASGNAAILAMEIDPAAVGAITGTVGVTLGAATSTASGTHTPPGFSGTVGVTLTAATSTASGTVTEPAVSGTATPTLAAATATASGTVTEPAITGTVGVTLSAATATASGSVVEAVTGTAAITLGSATSAASGTHTPPGFSGTATPTLGAATATASGTVTEPPITGTVGVTLGAATATASGSAGVDAATGNINVTLAAATASASGTVTEPAITGTVAVTLGAATGSANGLNVLDITGTITVTLAAATATAAGTTVAPYWWEYAPVGATTSTPAHTKTPVSYTPVHGDDQSPW